MNLLNVFKAVLAIAPKDNVKYYFNAVHVQHRGDSCIIEATDGALALRVSVPSAWFNGVLSGVGDHMLITRESLAKAVDRHAVHDAVAKVYAGTFYRGGKLELMTANFPYLDVAAPSPDGSHCAAVDTDRLCTLLSAINILRQDCTRNVSKLGVGGNVGLSGHADEVTYVAFLAPASR